ncbi:MAG: hypothetical protein AAF216_05480 [Pseudomonadota bacterium]
MKDVRNTLGAVWRAAQMAGPPGGGRAIMFVGTCEPAEVSSLAASFAWLCAERGQGPVWLLDLDFRSNPMFQGFDDGFAGDAARPGRAFDARLGGPPLYSSTSGGAVKTRVGADPDKLLSFHAVTGSRLLVSRFRTEALAPGQRLVFSRQSGWWRAARSKADWIIVHAPPTQGSGAALSMAGDVDGTIMAIEADKTGLDAAFDLRDDVEAEGGRVIGTVMTGVRGDARFATRIAA